LFGREVDRFAIGILSGAIISGIVKFGIIELQSAFVLADLLFIILVEYKISVDFVCLVVFTDRILDVTVECYPAFNVGLLLREDNIAPVFDVVLFVPEELNDLFLEEVAS
jgi:hypothetical protein